MTSLTRVLGRFVALDVMRTMRVRLKLEVLVAKSISEGKMSWSTCVRTQEKDEVVENEERNLGWEGLWGLFAGRVILTGSPIMSRIYLILVWASGSWVFDYDFMEFDG